MFKQRLAALIELTFPQHLVSFTDRVQRVMLWLLTLLGGLVVYSYAFHLYTPWGWLDVEDTDNLGTLATGILMGGFIGCFLRGRIAR